MPMLEASRFKTPPHVSPSRVVDFDVFADADLLGDLHSAYVRLQERTPEVFYTPAHGGHWVITRHEDIQSIALDPEHFSSAESSIPRIPNPIKLIPVNLDPPDNIPYRQLLMPYFSPKAIAGMSENIRRHARGIVASVAAKGECNFVDEVAARFPVTVFMELMGFPMEQSTYFRSLAEGFFTGRDDKTLHEVQAKIVAELVRIIELRRFEPKGDLVSHLVSAKIQGRPLTMDELTAICMLLFLGGLDTVTNALSFSARFLAVNPAVQDRLLREGASFEQYVEESLRMFGVVNTIRLVSKDCERFGVQFRKGDMILCILPLAGRDKAKNPDPNTFDMDRKKRSYLVFNTGPHLCLGHFLARVEMRIFFEEWMSQIGRFGLSPGFVPRYRAGFIAALESLSLSWTPLH